VIAKRTAIRLATVLIAVVLGVFASAAIATPRASSARHTVRSGTSVRLTEGGWACSRGVTLTAYVNGVSPYGTLRIGHARVVRGRFTRRWSIPRLTDTLPWIVQAVQRCGTRTEVSTTPVTINAAATRQPHRSPLAATGAQSLDARGLQLIADEEGYKLNAQGLYVVYNDISGFCTAGYGHLVPPPKHSCTAADYNGPFNNLTQNQAVALLVKDANHVAAQIVRQTSVPLTQDQLDALVDFEFNTGGYGGSTLRKVLNQGNDGEVPKQLARWVHGVVGKGAKRHMAVIGDLVRRRGNDSRIWTKGEFPPVKHKLPTGTGTGGNPTPSPTPPPTPVPHGGDCANDNTSQPPPAGCYRVKFQVIPDHYPGDTQQGLGVGVGIATLEPSGVTISCLNPSDAGACVESADVPVNTTVTITATPGSESPDPATPVDSAFEKFTGSCTGSGSCALTPSSNNTVVDVYFVPAVVTLTLSSPQATDGIEMSANGEGHVATTDPFSPVYCPSQSGASMPLPCSMLVRVNGEVQVEADRGTDTALSQTPTFSDNCPARPNAPTFCDITLTADQTVTATFS
jgi:lysozyme